MELESSAEGGDTVTVKAVPAAVKSSLMLQKKTRSWEKTPITTIIADIAGAAGLDTLYRGPELVYERVEQRQESDLEFMQRITTEQGLRLAVKSDRVVVYAGQTADRLEPIAVKRATEAEPGDGLDFQSFRAKRTTEGIYTQCVVGYEEDPQGDGKRRIERHQRWIPLLHQPGCQALRPAYRHHRNNLFPWEV